MLSIDEIEKLANERVAQGMRYELIINPYQSLLTLAQDMHDSFEMFETQYPANQSATVRCCLARMYSIIRSIMRKSTLEYLGEGANKESLEAYLADSVNQGASKSYLDKSQSSEAALRLGYYQLYGLLVELRVIMERKTGRIPQALLRTIKNIFQRNILLKKPLTRVEYADCYDKYLELPRYLHIMPKKKLRKYEVQVYKDLMTVTSNTLKMYAHSPVYQQVMADTQKVIDKISAIHPLKYARTDLKIFNSILKRINEILTEIQLTRKDPADYSDGLPPFAALHQRNALRKCGEFKMFIRHVEYGKPSIHKAIAGVLVAFVGAILMLVSITAKFFSLGLSVPLSSIGTAVGVSTMLGGMGLFKMSRKKGLSKSLFNLDSSLFTAYVAPEQARLQVLPQDRPRPQRRCGILSLPNAIVYDDYY